MGFFRPHEFLFQDLYFFLPAISLGTVAKPFDPVHCQRQLELINALTADDSPSSFHSSVSTPGGRPTIQNQGSCSLPAPMVRGALAFFIHSSSSFRSCSTASFSAIPSSTSADRARLYSPAARSFSAVRPFRIP